jgi:magnesium chelatase subunit ChlD-like protein
VASTPNSFRKLRAAQNARQRSAAIAWLPTVVAKGPAPLQREHLRRQPMALRGSRLHCIVLDTSGSMRRRGRLALAKGHAAFMIEQAARQGDDVALLRFGGQGVELLLPPGRARAAGSQRLRPVGGGGGTPLAEALVQAERLLQRSLAQERPHRVLAVAADRWPHAGAAAGPAGRAAPGDRRL